MLRGYLAVGELIYIFSLSYRMWQPYLNQNILHHSIVHSDLREFLRWNCLALAKGEELRANDCTEMVLFNDS